MYSRTTWLIHAELSWMTCRLGYLGPYIYVMWVRIEDWAQVLSIENVPLHLWGRECLYIWFNHRLIQFWHLMYHEDVLAGVLVPSWRVKLISCRRATGQPTAGVTGPGTEVLTLRTCTSVAGNITLILRSGKSAWQLIQAFLHEYYAISIS